MLDWRKIVDKIDAFQEMLTKRNWSSDQIASVIAKIEELSTKRVALIKERDEKKSLRNKVSQEVAPLMKDGKKDDAKKLIDQGRQLGDEIESIEQRYADIEKKFSDNLAVIPNWLDADIPAGIGEEENKVIKNWGDKREFDFSPLPHDEWAEKTGLIDFDRAAKVSGSRFVYLRAGLAEMEYALIQFMLAEHRSRGYEQISVPHLVLANTLYGSGQFPKFKEDVYSVEGQDKHLIPTTEVPLAGFYQGEIIDSDLLPISLTGHSINFRSEAGSYGKDTKGMIRQHQFHKVELFKFVSPEQSSAELESMLSDAENILQKLELPYRVSLLCSGDVGFCATKTYDIEVWLPGSIYTNEEKGCYREISSCSNCLDFQARRSMVRSKSKTNNKVEFVHTLNGSGLAVGRCLIAIIENYQQADGSILIPDALKPFMPGQEKILPVI